MKNSDITERERFARNELEELGCTADFLAGRNYMTRVIEKEVRGKPFRLTEFYLRESDTDIYRFVGQL
jgi:hypothetical protein